MSLTTWFSHCWSVKWKSVRWCFAKLSCAAQCAHGKHRSPKSSRTLAALLIAVSDDEADSAVVRYTEAEAEAEADDAEVESEMADGWTAAAVTGGESGLFST